jgi:hypothetical protein
MFILELTSEKTDDGKEMAMTESKPESNINFDIDQQLHHSLVDASTYFNRRSINALISPQITMDKLIAFMTTINNLLNSRTKNTKLDKFTQTYRNLHKSHGYIAFKNLLSLWSCFINSIDVLSNIFRAYETRALNSKELNKPPESNPLEALKSSIDDANTNFAEVVNLIQTLKRTGEFDDIFVDKQDAGDETTNMPQYEEDSEEEEGTEEKEDDESRQNLSDDDDNEEDESEGPVYPGRDQVNIFQNYPQQPPVQTNRLFHYAQSNNDRNSVNSWQSHHLPPDRIILGGPR